MGTSWGLFLCNCRQTLSIEPDQLSFPTAPAVFTFASDPEREMDAFARRAGRAGVERVLICCCAPQPLIDQAFEASGTQAPKVHYLDLKHGCFKVHPESGPAHDKASRLLRAAMTAAEIEAAPEHRPLTVGGRILIAADAGRYFSFAERLQDFAQPLFVTRPLPPGPNGQAPAPPTGTRRDTGPVHCGELIDITGRLGDFHVIIEETGGKGKALREILADQVVVLGQDGGRAFKSRTGCYRLVNPSEEDLEKLAERLQDHTGEFLKPVHVTYASDACAGGSAGQESCGLCIGACPYGAIGRDAKNHLRMQVNHMACEGCGACVSACPTSALEFATPLPRALYARLAALLRLSGSRKEESPKAVVFHCGEEGQRVLLKPGQQGASYPASLIPVEMACLRHVSEANMLAAFHMGAAGVVLLGCDSCAHGDRELLYQKMDFCRLTLEAFGLGSERLRLITAERGEARQTLQALSAFAASLKPSPVVWNGRLMRDLDNRGVVTEAVASLIEQTGREPGRILLEGSQPFAFADVKDSACTLCRSCVNACPVHAFRLEESTQSLQFKAIACVACGLCETVCPEHVITLRREIYLEKDALEYQTMVQDPMVSCAKCGKPYINRKALETVEARLFSLESLLDTFAGNRKNLLRMCPDCRAVDAMLEVEKGWKP